MWIASKFGFFSVVLKTAGEQDTPAGFHVRARARADLEKLRTAAALNETEIRDWPQADYRYRIICSAEEFRRVMQCLGDGVDYENFKSMIGRTPDQRNKLPAYHNIWGLMQELQD